MFKLPDKIKEEIKNYKDSLNDFLSKKINPARFTGIRVPWGIYSHRGGKIFMNRIRVPAGQINAVQLKAIAYVARTFGNGVAHITTRQDIQVHEVKIEDTAKVIEYLKDYDLSPRGGGGNTVRNVTACVLSGICQDEIFDVSNNAISLSEYLLAQETSFNLPRKFKIGFSGCSKDCGAALVNDVGLVAQKKNGKKGFKVFVGGGMGAESIVGKLLEEFIPEEDLGYCIQAVKTVFYKKGDRRNKHHNRLRFLIKDMGIDDFKKLYLQELKSLKDSEYISLRKIDKPILESGDGEIPDIGDEDFKKFLKFSLTPQKQKGLASIELRIPRGDISAQNLEGLASLEKEFAGINFCTYSNQNIFICNIRKGDIYNLFLKIKETLKDFFYPSTLLDVVSCKGALTCNLGLCNSPGLTKEVERVIEDNFINTAVLSKLNIKINGCPNSCGQHPIGLVALHGAVRKVSGRPVPFYKLLLGGRKGAYTTKLAEDTGILIPAKSVPVFLKDFIARINNNIDESTDIYNYIDEKAKDLAKETAAKYSYVPAYSENKDFYIDWGKNEEFSLEGLGPGECGAGVLDMIEADLTDAKNCLDSAEKNDYLVQDIQKALFFSARALLVVKGSDPKNGKDAIADFLGKFIKEGFARPKFSNLKDIYNDLKAGLTPEERKEKFLYVKEFLGHVNELYKNMDPSFNFPKYDQDLSQVTETKGGEGVTLDLKGTPCPINYVKTKLFLENLKAGDIITVILDEGEPIDNVPKSLEADGHKILKIEKLDGFYKVVVKKSGDRI